VSFLEGREKDLSVDLEVIASGAQINLCASVGPRQAVDNTKALERRQLRNRSYGMSI
jgi:hypothetical protein